MYLPNETSQEYENRIAKQIGYDLSIPKTEEIRNKNKKRVSEIHQTLKELDVKMNEELNAIREKYFKITDPLRDERNFLLRGKI